MIAAVLDSYIFACPSEPSDEDIIIFIRSVLEWRDLVGVEWLRMFISAQTPELISSAGFGYPPWQHVSDGIGKSDLDWAVKDVFNLMNGFLGRVDAVEDEIGINDILLTTKSCQPRIHANRGQVFENEFERLLGLLCLLIEKCGLAADDNIAILSRSIPQCPTTVVFNGELVAVEPEDSVPAPQALAVTVPVFECVNHYLDSIDPVVIWTGDFTDGALHAAITLFTKDIAAKSGLIERYAWSAGPSFFETVRALNLRSAPIGKAVLRACAETILGQQMSAVHAIRTSIAANSPQLHRGNDAAWRRDIDTEYHLHYWNTDHAPELASVVVHKDLSIPA